MKTLKEYLDSTGGKRQMMETIDDVISSFDFEKLESVMDFLGWEWYFKDDNNVRVPDKEEIEKQARKHLYDLVEHAEEVEASGEFKKRYTLEGGGFYAELEIVDDDVRKRFLGDDAPDDFEHSVDIVLRFVLDENLSKFC